MQRHILIAALASGFAAAQGQPSDAERVVVLLAASDPLAGGKSAAEVLAPGSLDDALRAVARSSTADSTVRLRALRVVRTFDLAARLREAKAPRDLTWWLALQEIGRDVPEAVANCLLPRAFADDSARTAALRELDVATEVAQRFCIEWNEITKPGEAEKHRALEAELTKAAPACIPALLRTLTVPPHIAFSGPQPGQDLDPRQQVRALLGLAAVLKTDRAMPFFVMHTGGPSLTLSSNAYLAVQRFGGENFGAAFMVKGDDPALLAWWNEHKAEHQVVLDYLVHGVTQWVRRTSAPPTERARMEAWCAVSSLLRALGDASDPPRGDAEVLQDRLNQLEATWLSTHRK